MARPELNESPESGACACRAPSTDPGGRVRLDNGAHPGQVADAKFRAPLKVLAVASFFKFRFLRRPLSHRTAKTGIRSNY